MCETARAHVQAKALGYTEPDPRDDLAGMDVARKVTILARYVMLYQSFGVRAKLVSMKAL